MSSIEMTPVSTPPVPAVLQPRRTLLQKAQAALNKLKIKPGNDYNDSQILKAILSVVAQKLDVTVKEIESKARPERLAWPRHVTMYFANEFTSYSRSTIAYRLGKKQHTTVTWAIRHVESRIQTEPKVKAHIESLRQAIKLATAKDV